MREFTKQCLSVLLVCAVLIAATTAAVHEESPVRVTQDADALAVTTGIAIGIVVGTATGYAVNEYFGTDDFNTTALAEADAKETKLSLYRTASTQAQNSNNLGTAYDNYLNDTKPIATMEGKNAYIRALENGSSEAAAQSQAREAIDDYYTTKQLNLISQWETALTTARSIESVIESNPNVSDSYMTLNYSNQGTNGKPWLNSFDAHGGTKTVALLNGSTEDVGAFSVDITYNDGCCSGSGDGSFSGSFAITQTSKSWSEYDQQWTAEEFAVMKPYDGYAGSPSEIMDLRPAKWPGRWHEVSAQRDHVHSRLDTFINATYEQYQQGTIDTSDLVDPYLGARSYSPDSEQGTWTLSTFASMGYEPPKDLQNVASMQVTDHALDNTYTGILLSDGLPTGDTFETGTRYNATELTGPQLVVTDGGQRRELSGEFTVDSIETADGSSQDSLTYVNRTGAYSTTDISEFKEMQEELANLSAQIEARQQALRETDTGNGPGALFPDGLGSLPLGGTSIVVALGAIVALAIVTRS